MSALKLIQLKGRGIVIYLRQEGRGIGLIEKLKLNSNYFTIEHIIFKILVTIPLLQIK